MKSHFIVHTNGQDEWIRVDKRTYEKAIDKFCDDHIAELKEKDKKTKTAKKIAQEVYTLGKKQAAEMDRFWAEFGLLDEDITINDAIAFFKAKDKCIAELKEGAKNTAEIYAKQLAARDKKITELEVKLDRFCGLKAKDERT